MPYFHVIEGHSASIRSNTPYNVSHSVSELHSYKALKAKAAQANIFFGFTLNQDEFEVVFLVGKELYPYSHMYQGLTSKLQPKASEDELNLSHSLFKELTGILTEGGYTYEVDQGVMLSQFD